jgi:hypothetical protein
MAAAATCVSRTPHAHAAARRPCELRSTPVSYDVARAFSSFCSSFDDRIACARGIEVCECVCIWVSYCVCVCVRAVARTLSLKVLVSTRACVIVCVCNFVPLSVCALVCDITLAPHAGQSHA